MTWLGTETVRRQLARVRAFVLLPGIAAFAVPGWLGWPYWTAALVFLAALGASTAVVVLRRERVV